MFGLGVVCGFSLLWGGLVDCVWFVVCDLLNAACWLLIVLLASSFCFGLVCIWCFVCVFVFRVGFGCWCCV